IAQLLNLDAEQISIGDNFFALGGHSLLAVKLVAQVRRALGKELSVQAVFESNDLKGLAQQITQCSSHTGQDIAPIARAQTRYALSHAQQRLWFIDRLQGGSPEYNMAAAFEVEGHFNVAIAEQALLAIIMRHEVLRSVMCEVEGVPAQQILDAVDFTLHVHDLTSLPASEQALAVTALVERDKQLAFDLSQDVMLRAAFIDLAPARGVLVLNLHHIAGDGWSIPLLVKEFEQGYRALLAGEDTPLAPLPIQYIDYAHWQREPAQRDVFAMQLAYWQGQLADVPTVHELPLDGARSAQTNRDAALWQSQISTQDYQQITQQASRQGMSVFMLLHSALALVLSRHSHSSDSVMGTPVANRQQAQLSELLGFFVNTVVLRVDTAQASLADYWAHVKATHLAAQAHQDVPFEQVVEQCCEHRSQLHSPLFQISFDVQFDSELAISLPDVSVTRMAQSAEALKFELEITVQVSEQGVTVNWLYDRQL
ncbi:condensation domain-containing protein, partial [Pseudoalteromonas sp. SMS1]|uniref:condensation domain-containing protein n=1 Tax=Pseudoalteromonas sp. SMS1 TaxID=2908894 RepID=UPI001F39C7F8